MSSRRVASVFALVATAISMPMGDVAAQLTYSRGQNVSPAFEGWEPNSDGSFSLVFGYMNRNWLEELDVPVGPDNSLTPGPPDQGQPTHFLPRRNRFVFKVRVPADFGDQEMVWTLTTQGRTEHAYGSLRPDYILDNIVVASETGALGIGASNAAIRANTPPTISVEGDAVRRVPVGQPLTLVARVHDDSMDRPRRPAPPAEPRDGPPRLSDRQLRPPVRITVEKVVGLHLSWFVFRADGRVTFDPPQIKTWEDTRTGANSPWAPLWSAPSVPEDGRYEVRVTFHEPGTYVLRGRADDGGLYADAEITVVVAPVS